MEHFTNRETSIPRLGFGTWKLKGDEAVEATKLALDTGYRHIDTAKIYENEAEVGQAIRESGIARDEIFLTTKVWNDDIEEGRTIMAADESLSRLEVDYVDLLLLHWPMANRPIADQVMELAEIKKSGKAKLIGISNYNVSQLTEAIATCPDLSVLQAEYHPELDQSPILEVIRNSNMLFTSYSPLGRGESVEDETTKEIAKAHGKTPAQIILRWHLQQENVSAIPKAGSRAHIEENFDIFDFTLTDEDMQRLFDLVKPDGRKVNPSWSPDWDTGVAA